MQYDLFDSSEYPEGVFKPLHSLFKGTALVQRYTVASGDDPHEVNLTTGECSCQHGCAMVWYNADRNKTPKWIQNRYCVHKLKAMSDLVQSTDNEDNPEVMFAFMKAVATRYNKWEVVSTFHKYLRLGRFDMAYYYGGILCTNRGAKGVIQYLINIIYEETRDHDLRTYLDGLISDPKNIALLDIGKAIMWFCETPKKWDLHDVRIKMFNHEMRGYERLVGEFGEDVAKASEIIDEDMVSVFLGDISKAIKKKDYDLLQYCVKGIQKSKFPSDIKNLHELRNVTADILMRSCVGNVPPFRLKNIKTFYAYIKAKPESVGVSYHDLNAFADLIAGEPYSYGILPRERQNEIQRLKKLPKFPFDKFPSIPLFALDNHTYRGKALLRNYFAQVPYGTEQTDLDLRGCGAYIGVGWRYYAQEQFDSIKTCKWHEVKIPKWLRELTLKLFY